MTVVMEEQTTILWLHKHFSFYTGSKATTENTSRVVVPFKDQESANIVKTQLRDLSVVFFFLTPKETTLKHGFIKNTVPFNAGKDIII